MKVNSILETIGNTPHVKINRLFPVDFSVWVKLRGQILVQALRTG